MKKRQPIANGVDSVMFPATKGFVFTVSPEDMEWVSQYNWHAKLNESSHKTGWGMPYICRHDNRNKKGIHLHVEVWKHHNPDKDIPNGYVINHKDVDPTNNRYDNLECIPKWLDLKKRHKHVGEQEPLPLGISWDNERKKYRIQRRIGKDQIFGGRYDTLEQALEARCECYPKLCS